MNETFDPGKATRRVLDPRFPEAKIAQLRTARFRAQIILILGDILLLVGSFYAATAIYYGLDNRINAYGLALQLVPFYSLVAIYHGAYVVEALRRFRTGIARLAIALLVAIFLRLFMTFVAKSTGEFSRAIFIMSIIIGFASMVGLRFLVINALHSSFGDRLSNILVVEDGGPSVPLNGVYRLNVRDWGIDPTTGDPVMLERFGRLARDMDRVIVSCPAEERARWSFVLKGLNAKGEVISAALHEMGVLKLDRQADFTSLTVSTGPLGLRDRILKRMFDLAITVPLVILLSPVMLIAAIAIKLEDRGPIFFVQDRMGRANCTFKILKFRSMSVEGTDSSGERSASKIDERITRVGRFIRMTSIDELPQLLNVIRGEMSLVGPRPHALGSRAGGKLFWEIDPTYWQRHALKPGLTGLAQVRGHRGATDLEKHLTDRLVADLEYLATWSLWSDFKILMRTAQVVLHDRAF